jgi:hypothetical protein
MSVSILSEKNKFCGVKKNKTNKYSSHLLLFFNLIHKDSTSEEFKQCLDISTFLTICPIQEYIFKRIKETQIWCNETKKTYANSLKQIIKYQSTPDQLLDRTEFIKKLGDYCSQHALLALTEKRDNTLDYKADKNWITWENIQNIYSNLSELIKKAEIETKSQVKLFKLYQQRLLLGMYVNHPPLRLNYGEVLLNYTPNTEINETNNKNWISFDYICNITNDKVAFFKGPCKFNLHQETINQIKEIQLKFGKSPYLLSKLKNRNEPLDANDSICKRLTANLLKSIPMLDGKNSNLCIFIIRSARVTKFMSEGHSTNEEEEFAEKMRTNTRCFYSHYRKIYKADGTKIY